MHVYCVLSVWSLLFEGQKLWHRQDVTHGSADTDTTIIFMPITYGPGELFKCVKSIGMFLLCRFDLKGGRKGGYRSRVKLCI